MGDDDIFDAEYLAAVLKARAESVQFFSAANRPERELWVANEFLTKMGIHFAASELVHVTDDPPDVRFRNAEFEIKEILDPGRRRHAEFKAAYEKAKIASSPGDLVEHYTPRDITYQDIYSLVESAAAELTVKYAPGARARLDLLFYVNLEDVHGYMATSLPSPESLRNLGFRTISFVMGTLAGVLAASNAAPEFLRVEESRIKRGGGTDEHGAT